MADKGSGFKMFRSSWGLLRPIRLGLQLNLGECLSKVVAMHCVPNQPANLPPSPKLQPQELDEAATMRDDIRMQLDTDGLMEHEGRNSCSHGQAHTLWSREAVSPNPLREPLPPFYSQKADSAKVRKSREAIAGAGAELWHHGGATPRPWMCVAVGVRKLWLHLF